MHENEDVATASPLNSTGLSNKAYKTLPSELNLTDSKRGTGGIKYVGAVVGLDVGQLDDGNELGSIDGRLLG